jgi:hypothetical protein
VTTSNRHRNETDIWGNSCFELDVERTLSKFDLVVDNDQDDRWATPTLRYNPIYTMSVSFLLCAPMVCFDVDSQSLSLTTIPSSW